MFDIILKTLRTGTVTGKYYPPPEGFRGKPELLPEKCTLCGECAKVCPPGVIWLKKVDGEESLTLSVCGCIFCGRCEEVCPRGAITLTREYELASKTKDDLVASLRRTA